MIYDQIHSYSKWRVTSVRCCRLQPPACECFEGYGGARCETERDECLEAGPGACLHAGRCIDAPGAYLCDCENTGTRCAPSRYRSCACRTSSYLIRVTLAT